MPEIHFEDLQAGSVTTYGGHVVDRDAMVAFAREYDTQPFHLDEEAARSAPIGRLIASGWYTASLQMRMLCDAWLSRASSLGGPGVEAMRWLHPVAAGDVLSTRQTVLETRPLRTRPGVGIARLDLETLNQDGIVVMRLTPTILFGRRDGPAPQRTSPRAAAEGVPAPRHPVEDEAEAPRFFEEVEIGRGVDLGTVAFTGPDIVAFASLYDPQIFHLDEAAARAGPFGALAASGWHTGSAWMALYSGRLERLRQAGRPARISVSPGIRALKWLRPVLKGETIRYGTEPVEARPLASRPGWGVVSSRNTGWNARGEQVFEFVGSAFWAMRTGAG